MSYENLLEYPLKGIFEIRRISWIILPFPNLHFSPTENTHKTMVWIFTPTISLKFKIQTMFKHQKQRYWSENSFKFWCYLNFKDSYFLIAMEWIIKLPKKAKILKKKNIKTEIWYLAWILRLFFFEFLLFLWVWLFVP